MGFWLTGFLAVWFLVFWFLDSVSDVWFLVFLVLSGGLVSGFCFLVVGFCVNVVLCFLRVWVYVVMCVCGMWFSFLRLRCLTFSVLCLQLDVI